MKSLTGHQIHLLVISLGESHDSPVRASLAHLIVSGLSPLLRPTRVFTLGLLPGN